MLRLDCDAFKRLFLIRTGIAHGIIARGAAVCFESPRHSCQSWVLAGCGCAPDWVPCGARSLPTKREVPDIVAEPLAPPFETSDDAIGRSRYIHAIWRQILQPGVGSKGRKHFFSVRLPIGCHAYDASLTQTIGDQLDESALYQATLVMALLGPRIGKQNDDFVEALVGDLLG